MSALETQERTDLAALDRAPHGRRRRRPLELRIFRDHAARDVDLLELYTRVAGGACDGTLGAIRRRVRLAGDVDGPELRAHVALLEAREVGHSGRVLAQVVRFDVHRMERIFANAPRQIVVPIDDRLRGECAQGTRHVGIRGCLLCGQGCGEKYGCENRESESAHWHQLWVGLKIYERTAPRELRGHKLQVCWDHYGCKGSLQMNS